MSFLSLCAAFCPLYCHLGKHSRLINANDVGGIDYLQIYLTKKRKSYGIPLSASVLIPASIWTRTWFISNTKMEYTGEKEIEVSTSLVSQF